MRVYVESTIPSYVVARPARDLLQAARQQLTRVLLSWNCRHIANATIQARLRRLAESAGFELPVIGIPDELMENDDEESN